MPPAVGLALTIILTALLADFIVSRFDEDTSMGDEDLNESVRLSFDRADDITCKECGSTLHYSPEPVIAGDCMASEGDEVEPVATTQVRLHCTQCGRHPRVPARRFEKRLPGADDDRLDPREEVQLAIQGSSDRSLSDFKGERNRV
jgi:hypothetical protein